VATQLLDSYRAWTAGGQPTAARRISVPVDRIAAPTLVVTGAHDLDFFRDVEPESQVPGARFSHLDWAGHLPNLEAPAVLNAILLTFLRETLLGPVRYG
jgi:pimeloyl-ACP methyl ester carboxylesterase